MELETLKFPNGLEVFGNLHSNPNITANGNITICNDDNDNLVLNAEITNDPNHLIKIIHLILDQIIKNGIA